MVAKIFKSLLHLLKKKQSGPSDFLEEVSGVVHVGANIGQERELYAAHKLDVLWIEPIPEIFKLLDSNIRELENQLAIQALVTDTDNKEYEFHIANNCGESSSILELKHHKEVWPEVNYTTTVQLKSTTLASLFKQERLNPGKYQALIMDTQGSELLVLRGSVPLLKHFKFIKTEVPDFESYEGCCQLADINSFMLEHGYNEFTRTKFADRAQGGSYYDIVYKRHS